MRFTFESASSGRLNSDNLAIRARTYIDEHRVKEGDFKDIYPTELQVDLAKVSDLDGRFSRNDSGKDAEQKKSADMFEAAILKFGESYEWLGSEAMTTKTSKFDDYTNGVDIVVEFSEDDRLAVDITYSSSAIKKFERILQHIKEGHLGNVKYFISQLSDTREQLDVIPEVVIGASLKTVADLSNLMGSEKYSKEKISTHYAQIMILKQIREQLDAFSLYAVKHNRPHLVEKYTKLLEIIDAVLQDKVAIEKDSMPDIAGDAVHSDIMTYIKSLKKSLQSEASAA